MSDFQFDALMGCVALPICLMLGGLVLAVYLGTT